MIAAVVLAEGHGLHSLELAFLDLLVFGAAIWLGRRDALLLAAAVAALLVLLALRQGLPAAGRALVTQGLLIGCGLGIGLVLSGAHRRNVHEVEAQRRRFRSLLEMAVDHYWELDEALRFTNAGEFFEPATSLPPSVLGKHPWESSLLQLDPSQLEGHAADLRAHRPFAGLRASRALASGETGHFLISGAPRFASDGRFLGYWGIRRNVTREVEATQAVTASEARLRELFERAPSAIVLHRQGEVIDANPAAVALFGFASLDALRGQPLLDCFEPGESRERARQDNAQLAAQPLGHTAPAAEYRLVSPADRPRVVSANSSRIDHDGQPALLSIYTDQSLRWQAEQAVARSEALLSHTVATTPDAITLTDLADGRYVMVNPSFLALTGYARDEVVGRTSLEMGIWSDPAQRQQLIDLLAPQGAVRDFSVFVRTRQGRHVSMLLSASRFRLGAGEYIVTVARDMSAMEQARLEREAIFDNATIGIAFTRDEHFTLTNPRFEQMFGWPAGSMKGQSARAIWPGSDDFDAAMLALGSDVGQSHPFELERLMLRRDGSEFRCRVLAKAVDPSHPSRGGTIWLTEDATARHQVEMALAQARDAAEAASLAKSAFLANTSHEIRTPLNALLGLAALARSPALDEQRRTRYIEQISDSARTLSAILSDILDLSKIEAGKLHVDCIAFDLHDMLLRLREAYGALARNQGLSMSLEIMPDLPLVVSGDPMRLRQILSNFLNNALKFTASGHIRLTAMRVRNERVRFEVLDTGIGIDAETQARLFTAFSQADNSTTRRVGGTGLGLSICRELALLMGGEVGVVSLSGQGSQFWAEVPLPDGNPLDVENTSTGPGLDPVSGTHVLLVEDNAVNMMIAVALLEQWDVRVSQASDGPQAIAAVDAAMRSGQPLDAVLMDLQMPGMSGHEAVRELRQRYPKGRLPIIALTAAALVSERDEALAAGMNDFLVKPIDARHLRATLARVLRSRDST